MTLVFHLDPCNECRKTWASSGWWCFHCKNSGSVVDEEGEEVDDAVLKFRHDTHCEHVFVESLFVNSNVRRRGIGQTLVTNLQQRFPIVAIRGNILDYKRDSARIALLFWRAERGPCSASCINQKIQATSMRNIDCFAIHVPRLAHVAQIPSACFPARISFWMHVLLPSGPECPMKSAPCDTESVIKLTV